MVLEDLEEEVAEVAGRAVGGERKKLSSCCTMMMMARTWYSQLWFIE